MHNQNPASLMYLMLSNFLVIWLLIIRYIYCQLAGDNDILKCITTIEIYENYINNFFSKQQIKTSKLEGKASQGNNSNDINISGYVIVGKILTGRKERIAKINCTAVISCHLAIVGNGVNSKPNG